MRTALSTLETKIGTAQNQKSCAGTIEIRLQLGRNEAGYGNPTAQHKKREMRRKGDRQ